VAVTSGMVLLMAILAAIFFFLVDWLIRTGLTAILGFFG
jgi:preprotein translocase subunit SecE